MKRNVLSITRWLLFIAVGVWATLSFIAICGEDDPQNPMSLLAWILFKVGSITSFAVSCWVMGRLESLGLLPSVINRLIQEED